MNERCGRLRRLLAAAGFAVVLAGAPLRAQATGETEIAYMEQPTGIALKDYASRWPALSDRVASLDARQDLAAARDGLREALEEPGALNLLAQLERQAGDLDAALAAVDRAVELEPDESRHYLQRAMICHAELRAADGGMARWQWHNRTTRAYRKALELDPDCPHSRYYLAYTAQQTPKGMGGDPAEALRLAREGVERGQLGFTVVVADLLRLQGDRAGALETFDLAVEHGAFKINALVAAVELALEQGDLGRAERYGEFLVRCRPDSARSHVALGDAHREAGRTSEAQAAYERALAVDAESELARARLGDLTTDD